MHTLCHSIIVEYISLKWSSLLVHYLPSSGMIRHKIIWQIRVLGTQTKTHTLSNTHTQTQWYIGSQQRELSLSDIETALLARGHCSDQSLLIVFTLSTVPLCQVAAPLHFKKSFFPPTTFMLARALQSAPQGCFRAAHTHHICENYSTLVWPSEPVCVLHYLYTLSED